MIFIDIYQGVKFPDEVAINGSNHFKVGPQQLGLDMTQENDMAELLAKRNSLVLTFTIGIRGHL